MSKRSTTRRDIIKGAAGVSLAAIAAPAAFAGEDDPVVLLFGKWEAVDAEYQHAIATAGDDEERLWNRRRELFEAVAAAKATTLQGIVMKLRLAAVDARENETIGTPEDEFDMNDRLAFSALADAERLLSG